MLFGGVRGPLIAMSVSVVAASVVAAVPTAAAELRGAGASFPANLYAAWIEALAEEMPELDVAYEAVGSGEGISRFMEGEVDIGGTDRPLTDEQIAEIDSGVLHVPAAAGMVVLAYNIPEIDGDLRLSRTALGGIFSGEIRYWDDPLIVRDNPDLELPHRSIAVVGRRDSSGTTFAFTSHLNEISDVWRISGRGAAMIVDWPAGAMTAPQNEGVAGRIAISENSIGYVEFSFAQMLDLPVALIQNQAGEFVAPDPAAGSLALGAVVDDMPQDGRQTVVDPTAPEAYPIVSYSWLLVREAYEDEAVAAAVRDYISWGVTEGQQFAEPVGLIPLPSPVADRAQEMLAKVQ